MHRTISKRINNGIRERLKDAEQLDQDKRLKASAEAMTPLYSYDPMFSPHEEEKVDARAQRETWDDMLRPWDIRSASGPRHFQKSAAVCVLA
jgi:hypothetical protein